jgi:hypothetical protein
MNKLATLVLIFTACFCAGCRYERLRFSEQSAHVLRSEVVENIASPNGSPTLAAMRLKGPPGGPQLRLARPSNPLVLQDLGILNRSCADTAAHGDSQVRIAIPSQLVVDYLGARGRGYKEYWALLDSRICRPMPWLNSEPEPPRYLLCASDAQRIVCVRDLLRGSYSASFELHEQEYGDIESIERRVKSYLDRVVVGPVDH